MISDKCYDLATALFKSWLLIDAAKKYVTVEERKDALAATYNAKSAVYDAGKEGALTESEITAITGDLEGIANAIRDGLLPTAKSCLEGLSEQTFMHALQEVVKCECKGNNPGVTTITKVGNPTAPTKEVLKLEKRIPLELLWKDEPNYLAQLTEEIREHGITEPITIRVREDGSQIVWDGLHRLAVAQKLGIEQIPVIYTGG